MKVPFSQPSTERLSSKIYKALLSVAVHVMLMLDWI
jgi:hypothetical protein